MKIFKINCLKLFTAVFSLFANVDLTAQTCNPFSSAFTTKYGLQSFYVPTANDPLIKVNIAVHIFLPNPNDPNPVVNTTWKNDANPNITDGIVTLTSWLDEMMQDYRYSQPRHASYDPQDIFTTPVIDSKIEFNLTGIHFHTSTALYTANAFQTGGQQFIDWLTTYSPGWEAGGIPIILNGGTAPGNEQNGAVFSNINPGSGKVFFKGHLTHEIGHCFGLGHMYYDFILNGGGARETLDCLNSDFLSDVFPSSCPYQQNPIPAPINNCTCCYEDGNNGTNNIMSSYSAFLPNNWMSNLQMGRRIRAMHLSPIRQHVADMVSDHTNTWDINQDETWDFDIQMYRDIVVKPNRTLTLRCKVAMAREGKIIVEKGARLIIDQGQVTGWSKIGLWDGVEVDGDANFPQSIGTNGLDANHGIVELTPTLPGYNQSQITRASVGILSSGGIVLANGALFNNNKMDVEFKPYPNYQNSSQFENCEFRTDDYIGYTANNSPINPFAHVKMTMNKGITFKGCKFRYFAGSKYNEASRGFGIESYDATFTVDKLGNTRSLFSKLVGGIYSYNAIPSRIATVKNTDFFENLREGIQFNNMANFVLENNSFQVSAGQNYRGCGVYLNSCFGYNVRNNEFKQAVNSTPYGIGIYVFGSGSGAHEIYRNTFKGLHIGVAPLGTNGNPGNVSPGLRINCNDFTVGSPNNYDVAMMTAKAAPPTVSSWQSNGVAYDPPRMVSNKYGAVPNPNGLGENRWYIEDNSVKTIYHYNHNNMVCRITPQPSASDAGISANDVTWVNLNYSNDCPASQPYIPNVNSAQLAWAINSSIQGFRAGNAEGQNDNDIQAILSAKLNFFLNDSIYRNADSVIAIYNNNVADLDNADVMTVFSYMDKGDFESAETALGNLSSEKTNWYDMLELLIYLEQHPEELYDINNSEHYSFLSSCAAAEGQDGQGCARAIIEMFTGNYYEVPRPVPDENQYKVSGIKNSEINSGIVVFPNPAKDVITVKSNKITEKNLQIVLTDANGRKIFQDVMKADSGNTISLKEFSEGVYFLNIYCEKENIYQSKVIHIK